jgi:hypothetical protein
MNKLITLLSVILLSSCATSYQSSGFTGGYVDTQLSETLWKVSVGGNGSTSQSKIGDIALLRASELTIDKGYKYFIIANRNQDKLTNITNRYSDEIVFEMLNDKIDGVFIYDAQIIYNSLSEKYIK